MTVTSRPIPSPLETLGRRVRVIVNPVSGKGRHLRHLGRLRSLLKSLDFDTEILLTNDRGDAERYASDADPSTALLLCVGGDGTLNEIVNGNIRNKVPIALVPAGTGNILRKEFRLPRRIQQACRLALEGQVRWLDAMKVNGRLSLLVTGAGFDSRVAHEMHLRRNGTMRMSQYVWPMAREVFGHHHAPVDVYGDGELLAEGAAHVIVGNARCYGGPFEIANRANPCDGRMDAVIFLDPGRAALLGYIWGALRKRLDRHPGILYKQVRSLEVRGTSTTPYQIDGDPAGFLPMKIEMLPRAVPIITA